MRKVKTEEDQMRDRERNRERQRTGINGGKNSLLNKWYPDNYITTCKGIRL